MRKKERNVWIILLAFAIICAALLTVVHESKAYERYYDGCQNCHGAFTGGTSPKGSNPGNNKMDMHTSGDFMQNDCDLCHSSGPKGNPYLAASRGTSENPGQGCTGCHGREEDAGHDSVPGGRGAGLRQHHWYRNTIMDTPVGPLSTRSCVDCHSDTDPVNYIPVGEHVKPPYYGTGDTNVDGPCNPVAQHNINENWTLEDFIGLDNDGDGLYDMNDPDCGGLPLCTDSDNDGYADCNGTCAPGHLICGDCNDSDGSFNPGAPDLCDGLDNDCDGTVDEDCIVNYETDIQPVWDADCISCHGPGKIKADLDLSPGVSCGNLHNGGFIVPGDSASSLLYQKLNTGSMNTKISQFKKDMVAIWIDQGASCGGPGTCTDNDFDGYGNPGDPSCANGAAEDCNDSDPDINPGAVEGPLGDVTCNDAIDNDCDGSVDEDCIVSYETNIQPVWDADCISCHAPGKIKADLDLSTGVSCGNLHNGGFIVPGDSASSLLYQKLNTGSMNQKISQTNKNMVAAWIDQGASCGGPGTCTDNDFDGYGNPGDPSCANGAAEDCNDSDPDIHPGVPEGPAGDVTCNDTVDNDCDGTVDEDCIADYETDIQPVWNANCINCHGPGKIKADLDLTSGVSCGNLHNGGFIVPGDSASSLLYQELNTGSMNQKISQVNKNTVAAWIDQGASCGGPGTCTDNDFDGYGNPGDPSCANGAAEDCNDSDPDSYPGAPELCDGLDNDCDGSTDENLTRATTCGAGECSGNTGEETCTAGTWGGDSCDPLAGATTEVCDNLDNDCDGSLDENLTRATTCGVGECASAGQTTCAGGTEGDTCTPGTPSAEICDGLDNDCNNLIDEFFTELGTSCTVGFGACEAAGIYICAADGIGTECDATPGPPGVEGPEGDPTCSDTIDNDCDNLTDSNDPDCPSCTPTGTPETLCNGIDDDCDDLIDEDYVTSTTTCGIGMCAGSGLLECINGQEQDSCVAGTPGVEGPEGDPTCSDGNDNDCDGVTDAAQDPDCGAVVQVPPPVQQNIGFPDRATGDLIEDDCRFCHEDPNIVDDANIPNRHHLLALQPEAIPPGSLIFTGTCSVSGDFCRDDTECPAGETCVIPFAPVDPDTDKDGQNDTSYKCNSCHPDDTGTPTIEFQVTRDCILCHSAFSPHHMTAQAQAQNCDYCHGPVDNPFDGHPVGQNPPSAVTPNRCCGNGLPAHMKEDGSPVFSGGCDYCHDTGLASGDAANGIVDVRTSEQLHHDTGLFDQQPAVCDWCHQFVPVDIDNPDPFDIRTCERCHGISSIHNILVDSDATGLVDTTGDGVGDLENLGNIIPNLENTYWGHVGNSDDCWGCHGYGAAESNSATGPIIPNIYLLSAYSVTEGTDTPLTITGSSLMNTVFTPGGPVTINSVAVLTADDGTETTLATLAISETSMEVTVPGTLAPGSYVLRAVKDISDSNAVGFTVVPAVTLTGVNCERKKGILTITGSGFTEKPEGTDAYLNVQINGVVIGLADLISWSDSQIRVSVDRCSRRDAVSVNALFGFASDGKPCKEKRCR